MGAVQEGLVVALVQILIHLDLVEVAVVVEQVGGLELVVDPWRKPSLEFQEMIIQYLLKFQKLPSYVMAKLMEATMLILNQNAKPSTFVPTMEMEDLPNTASCVLMEQFSSNSILFVTGGLMWTVLLLSPCIH